MGLVTFFPPTPPRIPVITDTHFGARGDSPVLYDLQEAFFRDCFWPAVDAEGDVTELLHLGDVTDRRRYILYQTATFAKRVFFEPARERGIHITWILGNHDLPFKQSTDLSSHETFKEYQNVSVIAQPTVRQFHGTDVLLMPWLCEGTMANSVDALKNFRGRTVAGHFELLGFEMYKGMPNTHDGLDPAEWFADMALVMSGHYHHRSTKDAIHYLGSPYDMVWSDADDSRGFHWWTPETHSVEFVESPHRLFSQWTYDDLNRPATYVQDLLTKMAPHVPGKIIKVLVRQKTQPVWYETFADAVVRMAPHDYQFIDDPAATLDESSVEREFVATDLNLDTLKIIRKHVQSATWSNTEVQQAVVTLMTDLYTSATDHAKTVSRV